MTTIPLDPPPGKPRYDVVVIIEKIADGVESYSYEALKRGEPVLHAELLSLGMELWPELPLRDLFRWQGNVSHQIADKL